MVNYVKRLYAEAKGKATTYVALGIAASSRVAAHAEDLLNSVPQLKTFLPQAKVITTFTAKWLVPGLGLLVVWTRVRRTLGFPDAPPK